MRRWQRDVEHIKSFLKSMSLIMFACLSEQARTAVGGGLVRMPSPKIRWLHAFERKRLDVASTLIFVCVLRFFPSSGSAPWVLFRKGNNVEPKYLGVLSHKRHLSDKNPKKIVIAGVE